MRWLAVVLVVVLLGQHLPIGIQFARGLAAQIGGRAATPDSTRLVAASSATWDMYEDGVGAAGGYARTAWSSTAGPFGQAKVSLSIPNKTGSSANGGASTNKAAVKFYARTRANSPQLSVTVNWGPNPSSGSASFVAVAPTSCTSPNTSYCDTSSYQIDCGGAEPYCEGDTVTVTVTATADSPAGGGTVPVGSYGLVQAYLVDGNFANNPHWDDATWSDSRWNWITGTGQGSNEQIGGGAFDEYYCAACAGDPVNNDSGELYETYSDLTAPGRGKNLDFTRSYSSLNASRAGPLGYGWTHSYNMSLSFDPTTGDATVVNPNGSSTVFPKVSAGVFTQPSRVMATFVQNGDGTYTLKTNNADQYVFSSAGLLSKEADRNGYTTTLSYNQSNQLTTIADQAGRTLTLNWTNGKISSLSDSSSPARTVSYQYTDGNGNLNQVTDIGGGVTNYSYDTAHELTNVKDPLCSATTGCGGATTTYTGGQVTQQAVTVSVSPAVSRTTTWAYSGTYPNTTTTITDPLGNVTVDTFQNNELVKEVRGSGSSVQSTWQYSYDPATLGKTQVVDANNNRWKWTYDQSGNILNSTDPLSRTTTYTYNSFNEPLTYTRPAPKTDGSTVITTYGYDGNGNLLSVSTPLSGTQSNQVISYCYNYATSSACYNANSPITPGDMVQMTDATGGIWKYTYDSNGNRTIVTDPIGNRTRWFYNGSQAVTGLPTCQIAANDTTSTSCSTSQTNNYITGFTWNAYGDMLSRTDPLGDQTSFQYDANRNLTATTDAINKIRVTHFDLQNEPVEVDDGCSSLTSCVRMPFQARAYDADGHLSSEFDVFTRSVADGQMSSGSSTLTSASAGFSSGDVGEEVVVGGAGSGGSNLLASISTYVSSTQVTLSSSASTMVTAATVNISAAPTKYAYDALGRVQTVTDPLGNAAQLTYDAVGNLKTRQMFAGAPTTAFCFDAANELVGISYANNPCAGAMTYSFAYYQDGRRNTMTDGTGTATYTYDSLGRLTKLVNATGQEVDYGYTDLGNLVTSLTYPGNHALAKQYYANGWLQSVADWITPSTPTTFKYDADGNLCLTSYANGVVGQSYYDRADRLATSGSSTMVYASGGATACNQPAASSPLLALTYSRNAINQVTAEGSTAYGYDNVERLTSAGSQSLVYDAADHLTSDNGTSIGPYNAASEPAYYGGSGFLCHCYLSYDNAGNRKTKQTPAGPYNYTYDQLNRLTGYSAPTQVTGGLASVAYADDGDGLLEKKTNSYLMTTCSTGACVGNYAWDESSGLPLMLEDPGTLSASSVATPNYFIYGPQGTPVERITGGTTAFYSADQLGSIRLVTTASGAQASAPTYDAYGVGASEAFGFAGQYYDTDSRLYFMRARWYDANTGQFLSRDTMLSSTGETYAYAQDSPLDKVDPTGLLPQRPANAPTGYASVELLPDGRVKWTANVLGVAYYAPTGSATISVYVNNQPIMEPMEYTYGYGNNQKTGYAECVSGTWEVDVDVEGGTAGHAAANIDCGGGGGVGSVALAFSALLAALLLTICLSSEGGGGWNPEPGLPVPAF